MTDAVVPESNEPEAAPRPRRRRAASRPAGAPAKVEVAATEVHTSAAHVEPEATPAKSDEAPKRPTRRRATRKAAPATADEQVVVIGEQQAAAAKTTEQQPAAAEEATEDKKPTRRRRAAKPKADESADAAPAESSEEAAPPKQPARSRRKRATKKDETAPSTPPADADAGNTDDDGEDSIAAKLAEAEKLAEARRSVVANPFMSDEDRSQQLAALAGAIAAGDDETTEASSDDAAADAQPLEAEAEASTDQATSSADDATEESEDSDDDSHEDQAEEKPSRRRRRRGGRRRRRGRNSDSSDEATDDRSDDADDDADDDSGKSDDKSDDADEKSEESGDNDSDNSEAGTSRRRRRRRRRGGNGGSDSSDDEVTGIEGSTRMEAKRQRRKESRAAGRRRAPILSEAEFLARRESVNRKLIVRQGEEYTQLAVLEDDILVEHYVDRPSASSLIGNIYLGKIQNVLPSMEAAFIDIGRGRNAVLYAGEVDWESFGVTGEDRKVENVLKSGQTIVVQVTKDPIGQKGARLTHHISLPGRYIVYSPGGHLSGISRKLPDTERSRLRNVLNNHISADESVIVRTAAAGVGEDDLVRDVKRLKAQWEVIEKRAKQGGAPHALYTEPDLTLRIIRDLFTEDFEEILVQGNNGQDDACDAISAYVGHVAPNLLERVKRYEVGDDGKDVFASHRIDEQIAKALDRKVFLPSGGSLVIDRTEAMTVIDVNTGRFTGSAGNLEATVTSNNLEAAEEIVRQLRLRDLGGIIVVDFIDMVLPSNRELLLRRLVECLGRDRTRHQVAEVTSLGLVQMTRKRIGTGLAEAFTEQCTHCHGQGYLKFEEPTDSQAPADGGDRPQRRHRKR